MSWEIGSTRDLEAESKVLKNNINLQFQFLLGVGTCFLRVSTLEMSLNLNVLKYFFNPKLSLGN